ncbi:uncharacterized protein [Castor canadensis]|uniref:Uncharacterized protein n=1 Tax=Castor canadensis TaxID=51338 RepID=A0AC58KJB0_CASCN
MPLRMRQNIELTKLATPVHNCKEFLSEVTQVRADLKDTPLSGCKLNWYTDGSSFFQNGARRAGAAVVDQEGNTVWSSALPPETSAQKAKLIALAEALERAKGKRVNIYTDSRYAFGTIHVHGAIYRERGFHTAKGKHLKNLAEVQRLLMAVEKPKAVAVMYVPGHQSAKTPEAVGNNRADQKAKRVAMVDGIGPWIHHSHVRRANHQKQKGVKEWTVRRHPDNPLKLKLLWPRKHAEPSGTATDGVADRSDLAQCPEREPRRNQPSPAL